MIAATFRVETPCRDHLQQGRHQRLLAALVAREELGREYPVPLLGHGQVEGADPGHERARLGPIAVPGPPLGPLVLPRPQVHGHLGLQDRLDGPLYQPPQEVRVVDQRLPRRTMLTTIAHGLCSSLIACVNTAIVEDGGRPVTGTADPIYRTLRTQSHLGTP